MTVPQDETTLERQLKAIDESIQQAKDLQGLLSSLRYEVWNELMAARSKALDSTPMDAA